MTADIFPLFRPATRRLVVRRLDPMAATPAVWAASFVVCAALVAFCYVFVDRPITRFFELGDNSNPLVPLVHLVPGLLPVALLTFGIAIPLLAWRFGRSAAQRFGACAVAYVLSWGTKTVAKYIFGRTWPETWLRGNASFLRNGVYGMFPFHAGRSYGSFPSGHMCVTMAVLVVAWMAWPRLRPFWAVVALGMATLLIGLNFHFVGDVIAGAWLGTACGVLVVKAMRRTGLTWI